MYHFCILVCRDFFYFVFIGCYQIGHGNLLVILKGGECSKYLLMMCEVGSYCTRIRSQSCGGYHLSRIIWTFARRVIVEYISGEFITA